MDNAWDSMSQHELLAELDIVERAICRTSTHLPHVDLRPPDRRGRSDPTTRQSGTAGGWRSANT